MLVLRKVFLVLESRSRPTKVTASPVRADDQTTPSLHIDKPLDGPPPRPAEVMRLVVAAGHLEK